MSRLNQHIGTVRLRMALGVWLKALAWAGIAFALAVWLAILIDRLLGFRLPRENIWFWCGLGAAVAASVAYGVGRRPSRRQAAVAIDDTLALKEKFGTALYIRSSNDPFAAAALRDAEATAEKVDLRGKFPVKVPRAAGGTVAAVGLVLLTAWLLPTFDLFGVRAARVAKSRAVEQEQRQAHEAVRRAIARIADAPKGVAKTPEIQLARRELLALNAKPTLDPEHARGTAQKAEQELEKAIKQKIDQNRDYAANQEEMRQFRNMTPPVDETGPIADAHRNMAQGKFDEAVEDLSKAVNNFDKMAKKDQDKAAQQMKQLANALQQMASDPKVQQNVQKQLQQMGANQQQAQQMTNLMRQAAAGDKQATQQLQQAAKQLAQQMNQKGGQNPQQQRQMAQQIQQAMQQMQQKVNTQINAQQLAQSAQGLAQAMQQSAQGGNPGQSQNQGKSSQSANASGRQGQKPGGQQAGRQQMTAAAKQMQQQLQQMQAVANDAQQVASAQQNPGQGGTDGQGTGGQNPQNGNKGNGNQPGGNNPGQQWANARNPQPGQPQGGGPGVGPGNNRPAPEVAPFQVKDEVDNTQKDDKGRVLASTFVKAGSIKGEARMELHKILPSVEKDATDEVDEQRIPRPDQDVVRGYFGNLEQDSKQ